MLACTETGGHLGWVSRGGEGILGAPWTDQVMVEWLNAVMEEGMKGESGSVRGSEAETQMLQRAYVK